MIKEDIQPGYAPKEISFGGYTTHSWLSYGNWKEDPKAFLFSFINRDKTPLVMECIQPKYAIYCDASYGPT